MIVGRLAPKSNSSLLKNLVCDRGWGIYSAFFEAQLNGEWENVPVYISAWPYLNPAWFWLHNPWALNYPGLLMNVFEIFSFFTRQWYWPCLSLCFVSLLQYFCLPLLAVSDKQHLVMPLHMSCPLACPPSAQESPLVAAPNKTSLLRVFWLHFKSKEDRSWNIGGFPNPCWILVLTVVPAMLLSLSGSPSLVPGWKCCQCPRKLCEPHKIMLVSTAPEEQGTEKANKSLAGIGPWYMAFASEGENPAYFIEGMLLLLLYRTFLLLIKLNNFT